MMRLLCAALVASSVLPACAIDVQDRGAGQQKDVEIVSPVGQLSVHTNADADTGLRVYPGARPRRDDDTQSANVTVGNSLFGVKVAAAKFETEAALDDVAAFYRDELKAYGAVSECRGNIDFDRDRVRCRGRERGDNLQLATGTEDRQRIVALRPRGARTEIDLVYVQTR